MQTAMSGWLHRTRAIHLCEECLTFAILGTLCGLGLSPDDLPGALYCSDGDVCKRELLV